MDKWIGMSKIFVGVLLMILNTLLGQNVFPPSWQEAITVIIGFLVMLERFTGGGGTKLTVLPRALLVGK